jgi:hypothetical protein
MIQFNLLPDVKIQYIKTKRLKRFMVLAAFASSGVSLLILFLTFSFSAVQTRHLNNLEKDIKKSISELNETPDLTKILSVQHQLNALPALYDGRPAVFRLPDYLARTTPTTIRGFGNVTLDMTNSTLITTGSADTLEQVNGYVDTLKFTHYTTDEEGSEPKLAFSEVVLTSYSRDTDGTEFNVTFKFDPVIFDIKRQITLIIPDKVTTHADQSSVKLFDGSGIEEEGDSSNGN